MTSSTINEQQVHAFLCSLFEEDLHAKRVLSLSLATLGVIHAASLSVYAIGQALAMARGTQGKHGIKQVDRLLSNTGIPVWHLFALWVPYVLGQRTEALIALDWTDFEADDQTTLVASLVTQHGRSTPLVWLSVQKSSLKGLRNEVEDAVVLRLREVVASEMKVTLLADRGFADQKLYPLLEQVAFPTWCASARASPSPVPRASDARPQSGCPRLGTCANFHKPSSPRTERRWALWCA